MSGVCWWLVRHAPVPGGRISGQSDTVCDTSDCRAIAALAAALPRGARLVESGLGRSRRTAEALRAAGLDLPEPLIEPDLAEQNFGAWQGRSWAEIDAPDFWKAPATTRPPGGESFAEVVTRVSGALGRLSPLGGDIVAVAHAGSIRAAVAIALDLDPAAALRLVVEPLSLTRLHHGDGGWRIHGVNARFSFCSRPECATHGVSEGASTTPT